MLVDVAIEAAFKNQGLALSRDLLMQSQVRQGPSMLSKAIMGLCMENSAVE